MDAGAAVAQTHTGPAPPRLPVLSDLRQTRPMLEVCQHDRELIARIVPGGGEMGRRMRDLDWSNVAVGQPSTWSPSFRSALSICLGSRFPIALYWGDDLKLIYNDGWSPILGTKHPQALGKPARAVWPEIWDAIGPLFATVLETG